MSSRGQHSVDPGGRQTACGLTDDELGRSVSEWLDALDEESPDH